MARAFIAIGSNIAPAANVRASVRALVAETRGIAISMIYRTEPERHPDHPHFYNGVIEVETERTPQTLKFGLLRRIEASLGRQRTSDKYAPRTIDLDLLLYGDLVLKTAGLTLPDPDITERPVVAIPLSELAPDLVLPGTRTSIAALAANLPRASMIPLSRYTAQLRRDAGLVCLNDRLPKSLPARRNSPATMNKRSDKAHLLMAGCLNEGPFFPSTPQNYE